MSPSLFLRVVVVTASLVASAPAYAQSDADDAAALSEVEGLLSSPAARAENAAGDPRAAQAEGLFQGFPAYAQKELNAIVMQILQESGAGAARHTDAYSAGSAGAAEASFSPAVRSRIQALEAKLTSDPGFNSPANLERMQALFPAFLGTAPATPAAPAR